MNSAASQSSRAGCVGGWPLRPKSKTLGTSAWPKCRSQTWLTATRAVSGLSRSAIHRARASRRPVLVAGYVVTGARRVGGRRRRLQRPPRPSSAPARRSSTCFAGAGRFARRRPRAALPAAQRACCRASSDGAPGAAPCAAAFAAAWSTLRRLRPGRLQRLDLQHRLEGGVPARPTSQLDVGLRQRRAGAAPRRAPAAAAASGFGRDHGAQRRRRAAVSGRLRLVDLRAGCAASVSSVDERPPVRVVGVARQRRPASTSNSPPSASGTPGGSGVLSGVRSSPRMKGTSARRGRRRRRAAGRPSSCRASRAGGRCGRGAARRWPGPGSTPSA